MKKILSFILCIVLALGMIGCGGTDSVQSSDESSLEHTASWLVETSGEPSFGSIGGDWLVFALERNDMLPDDWGEKYYSSLVKELQSCGGVLSDKQYTEYSRPVLTLAALDKNPRDIEGFDILAPLGDFDMTNFVGVIGTSYALLALDAGAYEVPQCPEGAYQASRDEYVAHILECEAAGGGWGFASNNATADTSAMVLQALAKYQSDENVKAAIDRAITWLSQQQDDKAGFDDSCETVAQAIIAFVELGISLDDERFVKNGRGLDDRLMDFALDNGAFSHVEGGPENQMATEQAFLALTALNCLEKGETLYAVKAA